MNYYGNLDKKGIMSILDNGLASIKENIKDKDCDIDCTVKEFRKLYSLLYDNYTRKVVPLSYLVRFESRASTIIKMLSKLDKW